jgi:hypothetical protein
MNNSDSHKPSLGGKNAEKFVKLANKRVNKTIKDLQLIGNLANKRNYTYSDVQAKKIVKALQKELAEVKLLFEGGGGDSDGEFRL